MACVIAPGADADVVVYDPAGHTSIGVGEGRTHHMNMDHSAWEGFEVDGHVDVVLSRGSVVVDADGRVAERYPANPNGSPGGLCGLTTADGRFTILMPHPERAFRTAQLSWHPDAWGEDGPWMRMFRNARTWVER